MQPRRERASAAQVNPHGGGAGSMRRSFRVSCRECGFIIPSTRGRHHRHSSDVRSRGIPCVSPRHARSFRPVPAPSQPILAPPRVRSKVGVHATAAVVNDAASPDREPGKVLSSISMNLRVCATTVADQHVVGVDVCRPVHWHHLGEPSSVATPPTPHAARG